jgi:hypothetical protein
MSLNLKFYTGMKYVWKNICAFSDFLWTLLIHMHGMCMSLSTNPTLTYLDIKDDKIIIGPETDHVDFV